LGSAAAAAIPAEEESLLDCLRLDTSRATVSLFAKADRAAAAAGKLFGSDDRCLVTADCGFCCCGFKHESVVLVVELTTEAADAVELDRFFGPPVAAAAAADVLCRLLCCDDTKW
jgi:hypothetical protein